MKCVCGYSYVEKEDEEDIFTPIVVEGDEPFFISRLTLTYDDNYKNRDYNRGIFNKNVIVCPKCGTLKIDI